MDKITLITVARNTEDVSLLRSIYENYKEDKEVVKALLKNSATSLEVLLGSTIYKEKIEERARILAIYIIDTKATIRDTAKRFNVSKSTVHKDITERLEKIDFLLAAESKRILAINKAERYMRGGKGRAYKCEYSHNNSRTN